MVLCWRAGAEERRASNAAASSSQPPEPEPPAVQAVRRALGRPDCPKDGIVAVKVRP